MTLREEGWLMRVVVAEGDTHDGVPLYEAIVVRARDMHLAGAMVMRAVMGFGVGGGGAIHTAKLLESSASLPVLVEIIDTEERIAQFAPIVAEMVGDGLVTLEPVKVLKYPSRGRESGGAG